MPARPDIDRLQKSARSATTTFAGVVSCKSQLAGDLFGTAQVRIASKLAPTKA